MTVPNDSSRSLRTPPPSTASRARGLVVAALLSGGACLWALPATLTTTACVTLGNSGDASADAATPSCGTQTCGSAQVCLYRECTTKERCRPSTSCPANTIPSDCDGKPGCLVDCNPVVQGCRDVPTSCSGDPTCACTSICGANACANVEDRNVLCQATE